MRLLYVHTVLGRNSPASWGGLAPYGGWVCHLRPDWCIVRLSSVHCVLSWHLEHHAHRPPYSPAGPGPWRLQQLGHRPGRPGACPLPLVVSGLLLLVGRLLPLVLRQPGGVRRADQEVVERARSGAPARDQGEVSGLAGEPWPARRSRPARGSGEPLACHDAGAATGAA